MFPRNRLTAFATALLPIAFGSSAVCGQTMVEADRFPNTTGIENLDPSNIEDALDIVLDSPEEPVLHRLAVLLSDSASETTQLNLSVESSGLNSIVVAPGAEVRYEVIGVLSDDANEGLALFGFNLVFDGGDLSHADTPTGEPTPGCDNPMINFTLPWGLTNPDSPCPPACGYGGTIINGDLIQVGGAQNTINNIPENAPFPIGPVLTGVARPSGCGPAILVTGTLTAPEAEGIYALAVTDPFANVIHEGETGEPYWATEAAGVGTINTLTVVVSTEPAVAIDTRRMYWTEQGDVEAIRRAGLDGADVQDLVTEGLRIPRGVALDLRGGKMYWTDAGPGRIQRANLDGSNVQDVVTGLGQARGIALDLIAGKVYWTDKDAWDPFAGRIHRANLDGSNIEDLVVSGLETPVGIALDVAAGKMYWTNSGTETSTSNRIQRADLDGGNVEDLITTGLLFPQGIALDLAEGKMYWAGGGTRRIHRANLDGSNVEDLCGPVTPDSFPFGIALDLAAGRMYWTDSRSPDPGTVQRANLDGSDVEHVITPRPGTKTTELFGIALDLRESMEIGLDIKPESCPNPVNARSRGVVPIAVVGSESIDVTDIDVDSLVLTRADGVGGAAAPIGRRNVRIAWLEDVATPFDGGLCGCHAFGGDGFDDLVLKFSTEEMAGTLELGSLGRGTQLTLTISGRLLDGAEFSASDCIVLAGERHVGELRSVPRTAKRRR